MFYSLQHAERGTLRQSCIFKETAFIYIILFTYTIEQTGSGSIENVLPRRRIPVVLGILPVIYLASEIHGLPNSAFPSLHIHPLWSLRYLLFSQNGPNRSYSKKRRERGFHRVIRSPPAVRSGSGFCLWAPPFPTPTSAETQSLPRSPLGGDIRYMNLSLSPGSGAALMLFCICFEYHPSRSPALR